MADQIFNPYLPLGEYIPDAEPHVFGDRVYVYGSHDKEAGETFCMLDYVCYSAPVTDLKDWRYEGVIFKASQDPDYGKENSENSPVVRKYLYAPDVVKGNDGKYYLFYCLSGKDGQGGYHGPIQVAVCDTPAGAYTYLGFIRNKDGSPMKTGICFDPGVINDEGVIRVYYGTRYEFEELPGFFENEGLIKTEMEMFNKTREEILSFAKKESVMGAYTLTLEEDMQTVKDEPRPIFPYKVMGTSFEEHPFFEASSIRKIGKKYYFIYSSKQNHELCYATSDYPDKAFTFGGTIVSNGDVGFGRGELERLNMTGTTHGSIEKINGQWYVFYHRLTHKSDYSRQDCAEPIFFDEKGDIAQVHLSSCGLNGGPLKARGTYPAGICCVLTNGHMPHGCNRKYTEIFPHMGSGEGRQYIKEIGDQTLIGYRNFLFTGPCKLTLTARSTKPAVVEVYQAMPESFAAGEKTGACLAKLKLSAASEWTEFTEMVPFAAGEAPLYLVFSGEGLSELLALTLQES